MSHERNVFGPVTTTFVSGSRSAYDVKPFTTTSSWPPLSKSSTVNTKRGSVTAERVAESSKRKRKSTYVPDWIAIMPICSLQPLYPSVY